MSSKFKYTFVPIAALALLGGGIYLGTVFRPSPLDAESSQISPLRSPEEIKRVRSIPKPKAPQITVPDEPTTTATRINALAALNNPTSDPQTDIRIIEHLLVQARTVFHKLPIGENEEIVAFLQGANPREIQYIPDDDPNLNADGEVVDRWGTPYFFHALSRDRIEVRSAGPDRLHWSEDDVISETQTPELPNT
ncbi:hypothetical protein [Pelagicoccus sp. SDUM812005]|uniref:hypothetical protein n=1 Tax=Pelagicoccus sp. SDUM812005 TaxID=3041257 RepID=UPI00280EA912|nr:hypothetical protein [Pelagicoccus sp. SDUM812005]MDQ8181856.1 hypothetical protein [Pelagicoccus sp. SDUM812005]